MLFYTYVNVVLCEGPQSEIFAMNFTLIEQATTYKTYGGKR